MIHIIAEAGSNHNGSIENAKKLIDIAANAQADSVKFQIINTWGLYLPGNYEYGHYNLEDVLAFRKKTEFKPEDIRILSEYSKPKKIQFSASIFDEEGLNMLNEVNPSYIKIASGDLNNLRLIRNILANSSNESKLILSTGMSTLSDIERTVNEIDKNGHLNRLVLLHCVSIYPARIEETNLSFIATLKKTFGTQVGFSDHTKDSKAALIALGIGATWFEKHFTFDKKAEGLDHKHAADETELKQYVDDLRKGEKALIDKKEDKISEGEFYTRKRARRALYASRDMKAGEIIKDEDILCVRPEGPMQADEIDFLIGKQLAEEIKQYKPFTKDAIK
jgi:sialic acid synthase SpsE